MTFEKPNDFEIKDSVMVDGITEDYVWYHAKLLQEKMTHWDLDFQKLVKVMESRHNEHLRMLNAAMEENRILKRQLKEKKK
jgi:hypothetical protein